MRSIKKRSFVQWIGRWMSIVLLMLFVLAAFYAPGAAEMPALAADSSFTQYFSAARPAHATLPAMDARLYHVNSAEEAARPTPRIPLRHVFTLYILVIAVFSIALVTRRNVPLFITQKISCISICMGGHSPPAIS